MYGKGALFAPFPNRISPVCCCALQKNRSWCIPYCGVLFVSSHTDAVQAAVIFRQHIVLALCDGTADIGVFLFDFHGCLLRFHGTSDFICADLPCFLQNLCRLHAAASVETIVLTGQMYFAEKRYSYSMAAGQADYTCHFLKQNKKSFRCRFPGVRKLFCGSAYLAVSLLRFISDASFSVSGR